jgi:glycerol-3-phosphate cytidylyltransferase-like family protein
MMSGIKKYKPDTIAIGYDQTSFIYQLSEYLLENNIKSKVLTIKSYKEDIYKSSKIKKKLQ